MNLTGFLNKKYMVLGLVVLVFTAVFVLIILKNLKKETGTELSEYNLNDSLKAEALDDIKDLLNVDYTKYYDELKNYGEWIKIDPKVYLKNYKKENKSLADNISEYFLKKLFADNAFAYDDFYMNAFFVWKPSPGFSVGIAAGEPAPAVFVPYTYGSWVYTDYGWYFRAPDYEAEIVHHYGRWVFVPAAGWVWLPGQRWAPAWVHWEYDDDYIAWSPLVPNMYYVSNYIYVPPVYTTTYFVTVEKRYFIYPDLYRHVYYGSENNIVIKDKLKIRGDKYFYNYSVRNSGPRLTTFEKSYSKWNLKPDHVDFVNRGPEKQKSYRDVFAVENRNNTAGNFKSDNNSRQEKFSSGNKPDKTGRTGEKNFRQKNAGQKDIELKDKKQKDFRQKNKNENQNRDVTGKNREKYREPERNKKQKDNSVKNENKRTERMNTEKNTVKGKDNSGNGDRNMKSSERSNGNQKDNYSRERVRSDAGQNGSKGNNNQTGNKPPKRNK